MSLIRNASIAVGALSAAAFLQLPSHAQMADCGTTLAMGLISTSSAAGIDCIVGDKRYYGFEYDGPTAQLSIAENSNTQHTVTISRSGGLTATKFNYSVAILPASPTPFLKSWQTDTAGAISPNDYTVGVNWTNDGLASPITLTFAGPPINGNSSSGLQNFDANVNMSTTTHAITNGATVTAITDTITQQVPGPLPILGAGAAFGFSRQLRRRVQLSA
jgi:hypothetical protein